MPDRLSDIRDTALLVTACAAGIAIAPQFPVIGLPASAAAASGLAYRGKRSETIVALAVGVALAAVMTLAAGALAFAGAAAVLVAVMLLPSRSFQLVAAVCTALVAAGAVAADALLARAESTTLLAMIRAQAADATKMLQQALGSASGWGEQLEVARKTILMLWPSLYFQTAIWAAVFIIAAAAWASRRFGVALTLPTNREIDLTGHVLWGLVGGLVLLAAAPLLKGQTELARVVALNALFMTRTLFFIQGVAVFSAVFDVPRTGMGKMVGLYAALWVVDQFILIVSLIGMLDFWVNFRRLPRDGSTPAVRLEEPPTSV